MKWTPTHIQILLWLAFQDVKTRNANSKTISEGWPEINGETPSPRAVSEKLIVIKNGVEELGLAEFFGNGGVSVPRSKPVSSRSNSKNVKDIVRVQQAGQRDLGKPMSTPSTELQIEDVTSTQPQIGAPAPSNADIKGDGTVADSDIDGETATESDTDSEIIVLESRPVRKRVREKNHSLPKPEAEAAVLKESRPVRKQTGEVECLGSRSSRFKSEPANDLPLPPMELRRLPKRTYTDSLDVWFDSDSEPATSERQRKKPRNHYKSLVEETQ